MQRPGVWMTMLQPCLSPTLQGQLFSPSMWAFNIFSRLNFCAPTLNWAEVHKSQGFLRLSVQGRVSAQTGPKLIRIACGGHSGSTMVHGANLVRYEAKGVV